MLWSSFHFSPFQHYSQSIFMTFQPFYQMHAPCWLNSARYGKTRYLYGFLDPQNL